MKFVVILLLIAVLFVTGENEGKGKNKGKGKKSGKNGKNSMSCDDYRETATTLITNVIYPKPLRIVQDHSLLSPILEEDVKLRVTPVGSFAGFDGVIEYFYGFGLLYEIQDIEIVSMICEDDQIASQVNVIFPSSLPGTKVYPGSFKLTLMAFYKFNNKNAKVMSIDSSILNMGEAFDRPNEVNPATTFTYWMETYATICGISVNGKVGDRVFNSAGGTCVGDNAIWTNSFGLSEYDFCMAFVSGQINSPLTNAPIDYGSYNRQNSNTVVCRLTHVQLAIFDPALHCPHVGLTGGKACVDHSYRSFYDSVF
mmetsp:Transcript_22660/g.22862  ORF Transcript_22660/g.22862 Transcript_22660/m.22862 type:complete len:311 (-) Transcript_22660:153-1085(-)